MKRISTILMGFVAVFTLFSTVVCLWVEVLNATTEVAVFDADGPGPCLWLAHGSPSLLPQFGMVMNGMVRSDPKSPGSASGFQGWRPRSWFNRSL